MGKYKEFKTELKQIHITNEINFTDNLQRFLDKNNGVKILHIIKHSPYNVTLIYEVKVEIK